MITRTRWAGLIALGFLLPGLLLTPMAGARNPLQQVAFYLEIYGEVLPTQDPQVTAAHQVFAEVRAVADKNSKRLPKLVVVNSPGDPWAIALPDGHIVLSRQAVAICHRLPSPSEAQACLAFVLGHELAHLANDDYWHQEVHDVLRGHPEAQTIARFLGSAEQARKPKELAADDKGFIYAAMAGYPVDRLVDAGPGKANFFDFWMQQTNARITSRQNTAQERAAVLRQRLKALKEQFTFFEFGVRLSHFGYCDDALPFLREFQKSFPSREVLNNIGYCQLQQARDVMDLERARFYWLPLLLDGESRVAALTLRQEIALKSLKQAAEAATGTAEDLLREAVDSLQRAIQADPSYVPAKLNLAAAYLYLGQPNHALAVLEEAQALAPDNLIVQGLEAVALYEQGDADLDLWSAAVAKLKRLTALPEAPPEAVFNLARLLEVRQAPAEARHYWTLLAEDAEHLPPIIRATVCHPQRTMAACPQPAAKRPQPLPWQWPLPIAGFEPLTPALREQALTGWQAIGFDWLEGNLHGHIYQHPQRQAEVLELEGFVQLQVIKGSSLTQLATLSAYCTEPLRPRVLTQGTLWSCDGWAALTINEQVQEAWWVAK